MRKKWIIASIIVICTTVFIIFNTTRMNESEIVQVVATEEGAIQETIYASGKISSSVETREYIQQNGLIKQMDIQLGDQVKAGEPLLVIDTKDSEDRLIAEENNKKTIHIERDIHVKKSLTAAKELLQQGVEPETIIEPGEIELYELRLAAVDQSITTLKENIKNNQLYASVDGVVTELHVEEGQTVGQGTLAVSIVNPQSLRVKAYLNELDVSKVKVGMEATITGDAFSSSYAGIVSYLAPIAAPVDVTSRDVAVELWVDIEAPDDQLRPGYNATLEIGISQEPSLLVPLTAIRQTGDRTIVFLIENGLAVEREVTTGDDDGDRIEILTGLQAGEEVISKLSNDIAVGNKVKEQ